MSRRQERFLKNQFSELREDSRRRDRRAFMQHIAAVSIALIAWLFPRPQPAKPKGQDVAVEGVLEHGVSISATIDGGGEVIASLTVVPASEPEQASHA